MPIEQDVVSAVPRGVWIGGEWRDASGGARCRSRTPPPARRSCEVADATRRRTRSPRSTPPSRRRRRGPRRRRASAARSCAAPTRRSIARADELALLMTLEMGKPLAESRGRGRLRGRLPPLVRRGGGAHRRPLRGRAQRRRPAADDAPAGRPVPADHAVELPDGDGHAQDRPGGRRRLHDGRQAGPADAAVDARAGADPREAGLPAAC